MPALNVAQFNVPSEIAQSSRREQHKSQSSMVASVVSMQEQVFLPGESRIEKDKDTVNLVIMNSKDGGFPTDNIKSYEYCLPDSPDFSKDGFKKRYDSQFKFILSKSKKKGSPKKSFREASPHKEDWLPPARRTEKNSMHRASLEKYSPDNKDSRDRLPHEKFDSKEYVPLANANSHFTKTMRPWMPTN